MQYRPTVEGQRVSGIYRRSMQLASGRYALLDDSIGASAWCRGSRWSSRGLGRACRRWSSVTARPGNWVASADRRLV